MTIRLFVVVTKYKTNYESIRNVPSASYINVPELNQQERKGLLRRLSEANQLDLGRADLEQISRHLTGYPAQVHYAIDVIKHHGFPYLSRNYKLLSDYNEQEVSSLLEKHKDDPKVLQILALIGKYDAISITMLYEILNSTPEYVSCYEGLYQESLFELEGVNREYVRLTVHCQLSTVNCPLSTRATARQTTICSFDDKTDQPTFYIQVRDSFGLR